MKSRPLPLISAQAVFPRAALGDPLHAYSLCARAFRENGERPSAETVAWKDALRSRRLRPMLGLCGYDTLAPLDAVFEAVPNEEQFFFGGTHKRIEQHKRYPFRILILPVTVPSPRGHTAQTPEAK